MSPTYLLKIVTVGAPSVGKTSIIIRFSTGAFREHYSPTLGVGFAYKKMKVGEDNVNMQIWDLGSQDFLERTRANYYLGAQGAIFMYDVTSWESFNEVIEWKHEVDRNLDDYTAILIANKTDLIMERVVSLEEGQRVADQMGIPHMEASVRLDKNVNDAFETLARNIIGSFS
jgi:small GTP-binding protein